MPFEFEYPDDIDDDDERESGMGLNSNLNLNSNFAGSSAGRDHDINTEPSIGNIEINEEHQPLDVPSNES